MKVINHSHLPCSTFHEKVEHGNVILCLTLPRKVKHKYSAYV